MWVITRNFFLLAVVFTPGLALATSYSPTAADIELDAGQSSAVSFTFFHNESSSQDYFVRLQSAQVGDGPDEVLFSEISTELASWVSLSFSSPEYFERSVNGTSSFAMTSCSYWEPFSQSSWTNAFGSSRLAGSPNRSIVKRWGHFMKS